METAHKTDEEKIEYFDSEDELNLKIEQLALWIRESKHFVTFTGAGISTAAGISDYRSGINTVLKVGPGVWEKKKNNIVDKKKVDAKQAMQKAFPTITHLALAELMHDKYLKFLISQNVDGLHLKTGISIDKISELHGNTNLEICVICGKKFFRDFKVRNNSKVHDHKTGRKCYECKGDLNDSIINFNENLNEQVLDLALNNAISSDLMLCLGSSLRVTPAASLPKETLKNGGRVVIVNLQKTPFYNTASLNIFAKIEDVMERLMIKMNYQIPKWTFIRRVFFDYNRNSKEFVIHPRHLNDDYFSFLSKVELKIFSKTIVLNKEPFIHKFAEHVKNIDNLELKFHFFSHYQEPLFSLVEKFGNIIGKILTLHFDPNEKKWINFMLLDPVDELNYKIEDINIRFIALYKDKNKTLVNIIK